MATIPMNLAYEQVKNDMVQLVNTALSQYKIPMFVMEGLLRDLYNEVSNKTKEELNASIQAYQADIKKEQEQSASESIEADNENLVEE